jgi:hypothetical protein
MDLLKKPMVILYFLGIFAYVGTEQGVANWISEFLQTYHGVNPQTDGASTVSLFWGLMTAGTVLGLILLKFVDSRKVLIGFTLAAMVCLAVALFSSRSVAMIAFPIGGLFRLRDVVHHHFAGSEFGGLASWFFFGHTGYRHCGWSHSAFNRRMARRYVGPEDGDALSVSFPRLYPEYWILVEALDQ